MVINIITKRSKYFWNIHLLTVYVAKISYDRITGVEILGVTKILHRHTVAQFLLSSDFRSEGSIAIVKIFDFDILMIFHSTSLPESKNVF